MALAACNMRSLTGATQVQKLAATPKRVRLMRNAPLHVVAAASAQAPVTAMSKPDISKNMYDRHAAVLRHFPTALSVDDFVSRVEIALAGFGFTGDNTIAMTNLCRDEVTQVTKDKIEAIYGASFNTNGLGAVLTCGVTGMKAGLSHSPVCKGGRERYVFFAFPHIAIDSNGEVGAITRPGRPKKSCACGALAKCLHELKTEGLQAALRVPGVHDPLEPEYSILKQRLARRVAYEQIDVSRLDLVSLTQVAERTISDDLEYLVEKAVNPATSDYAVITGVEIHNWAAELTPDGVPSMEFIAPSKAYIVVDGQKMHLDLLQIPPMSFRQLQLLAQRSMNGTPVENIAPGLHSSALVEIPYSYLEKRMGGASIASPELGRTANPVNLAVAAQWPSPRPSRELSMNSMHQLERDMGAPTMESPELRMSASLQSVGAKYN